MKFLYTPIVLLLIVFCVNSCNLINPTEPVPTYVHVDSFSFTDDTVRMGTNSAKITCVYVYLNNQSIGIFDLPITFPVLLDNKSKLQLSPGYDFNGLAGVPTLQPMYQAWSDSISPVPGKTITVKPTSKYLPGVEVKYNVDFESRNPFNGATSVGDMARTDVDSLVFEGQWAGLVFLGANEDSATNFNSDPDSLQALTPTLLEINYKSNIPFTIGMYTNARGVEAIKYIAGFNAHPGTFNKVYVDLQAFVSTYQGGKFTLLLRAIKEPEHIGKPGYVAFDNIKIVAVQK